MKPSIVTPPAVSPAPAGGGGHEGDPFTAVVLPRDAVAAAVAISAARYPDGPVAAVVLAPADPLLLAVAAPVAAVVGGPVLIAGDGAVPTATQRELDRLAPTRVIVLGLDGTIGPGDAERIGSAGDDRAAVSVAAAEFVRRHAGTVRAFALAESDAASTLAGPVGAAAALRRFPVMVGSDAARRGAMEGERRAAVTYLVGRDAIACASQVPGGFPLPAPRDEDVPGRLAQLLRADGVQWETAAALASADEPSASRATGSHHDVAGNTVARSALTGPTATGPIATGPVVNRNALTESSGTAPRVTGPPITGATVNRSALTEPAVAGPAATEPGVAAPAVAGPAVSGPAVTGPGVTGPAVAGPAVPGPAATGPVVTRGTGAAGDAAGLVVAALLASCGGPVLRRRDVPGGLSRVFVIAD